MSRLLSFDGWTASNSINENIQAAKIFLTKRYVSKKEGIPVEDVTQSQAEDRENQKMALDNPHYKAILNIVGTNHGYVFPFVKFVVNSRATSEELTDLYNKITQYAGSLKSLPMSIEEYSNRADVNGIRSIDSLFSEFDRIELRRKHNWIIEKVNRELRQNIKSTLTPDEIDRLIKAAAKMDKVDDEEGSFIDSETGKETNNKYSFLSKTNAFTDAQLFLQRAEEKAAGLDNVSIREVAKKLRALEPEASIVYSNEDAIVLAIRTDRAQKELCGLGDWCINRGSWDSYGGKPNAVQINVFNFKRSLSDPLHLVGTTITDGRVTNSHNIPNQSVVKSQDPRTHFTELGYSEDVIDAIISSISNELTVKQFVTGKGLDTSSPIKALETAIRGGYSESSMNPQLKSVMMMFIKKHIVDKISEADAVQTLSKRGILNEIAAKVFNTLNLSEESRRAVLTKNEEIFNNLKDIVNRCGLAFNNSVTTVVESYDAIKKILDEGTTIND